MTQTATSAPSSNGELAAGSAPDRAGRQSPRKKRISIIAFAVVVLAVAAGGVWLYLHGLNVEETDDAFIAGDTYAVAPRIAGRLDAVLVSDNQSVEAGQPLARIDSADQQAAVDRERAALALAKAQLEQARVQVDLVDASTQAGVAAAEAQVAAADARLQQQQAELESARAESERAQADLSRYAGLSEQAVSRQRLDVVRSTAVSARSSLQAAEKTVISGRADVAAAESRLGAARADRKQVDAARAEVKRREAEVEQARATLRRSELELSYTSIASPAAGRVTAKTVETGDYVKEGRTLMTIVAPQVWVVANFKETQLKDMHPGQACVVHVDAYDIDLRGHVESIQAASGAEFSLLPAQNATGNYVKVVQRVPVKIQLAAGQDPEHRLRPGLSVYATVRTR